MVPKSPTHIGFNDIKDLNELQKLWLADYKEDFYKWLKERNQKLRNKKLENIL
jgi:hypothetical protein